VWRDLDEALLGRLEDEGLLDGLVSARMDGRAAPPRLHPRAAGLLASMRALPGYAEAREGGGLGLARLLEAGPLTRHAPELLHHLALFEGAIARALEAAAPELAARAWTRAIAAWLALAEDGAYLRGLARAVLGEPATGRRRAEISADDVGDRMVSEILQGLRTRAEAGARALDPAGRAALLALTWVEAASELSGASPARRRAAELSAERAQLAALEAALTHVDLALEEARAAGELSRRGGEALRSAIGIWEWAGRAEHVEQFVVSKLADVAWELYRAEAWDALRYLMAPFQPMIDQLAARIERDPSKLAYAAPCAQMYVFLADVQPDLSMRMWMAERAVRVCATHRNGRLTLAALLLDDAVRRLSSMTLVARRAELDGLSAQIDRAEALYPRSRDLSRAKELLAQARQAPLSL
jgi:hypothetical protein